MKTKKQFTKTAYAKTKLHLQKNKRWLPMLFIVLATFLNGHILSAQTNVYTLLHGGGGAGEYIENSYPASGDWGIGFYTLSNRRMTITNNGNVGIGTMFPSNDQTWDRVLDVYGTNHSKFLVTAGLGGIKTGIFSHSDWSGSTAGIMGTESYHDLILTAGYGNKHMTIKTNGNVGVGTTSPTEKLDIAGNINMVGAGRRIYMGGGIGTTFGIAFDATYPDYGIFYTEGTPDRVSIAPNGNSASGVMNIIGDGKVGIGTNTPTQQLEVIGNIKADGIILNIGSFPDYVFEKEYPLMPLSQVESYIKANKHLPGFPSEKEVIKTGANLGQLNNLLVEKVEELTLYTIAQEKQIRKLSEELSSIKKQLSEPVKKQ